MANVVATADNGRALKHGHYALLPSDETNLNHDKDNMLAPKSPAQQRLSSRLVSTFQTACLIFSVIAITLVLSSSGTIDRDDAELLKNAVSGEPNSQNSTTSRLPQCAQAKPVAPIKHRNNVWSSLTVQEAVDVRTWIFDDVHRLNLTQGDVAIMKYVLSFRFLFFFC